MSLTLVSFELCPYVQRVAIVLQEKQVPFSRRWVVLSDKPAWFLDVSPLGKVPVLLVGDTALFESAVICAYLDEAFAERPMTSPDPRRRAIERAWAEHASATLAAVGALYNAPDAEALETRRRDLQARFAWVDRALSENGPWFSGPEFGLVDAAYAPVFRYLTAFDRFSTFDLLADAPHVTTWRERLARRPSVVEAVVGDFDDRLVSFMCRRPSELGRMARRNLGAADEGAP
jgi:glutathione S-transferase